MTDKKRVGSREPVGRLNPDMLAIGRESRGMTQVDLSVEAGLSQGVISKIEAGAMRPADDTLAKIARALGYRPAFFSWRDAVYPVGSACVFARRRRAIPMVDYRQVVAALNVRQMRLSRLAQAAKVKASPTFPSFPLAARVTPKEAAAAVRKAWGVPSGPIDNVTELIERAGGVVVQWSAANLEVDALSLRVKSGPPLFFVNRQAPGDRLRFTLAHEIGHLVMHSLPSDDMEKEANDFAAAFLMPERDIRAELQGFSLTVAAKLKPVWKVSMASLIYRAKQLGMISDAASATCWARMSMLGYRKVEPIEIEPEEGSCIASWIRLARQQEGDLKELLAIPASGEIEEELIG